MALFDVHGRPDDDPGQRFFIGNDEETQEPVYIWVRRIPSSVTERIEKEHPGKMKRPKFGGALVRVRKPSEENLIQRKKYAWALVKIEGPLFRVVDDEGVAEFSAVLGAKVKKGEPVPLNGNLSDDAKLLILEHIPVLAGRIADALVDINHLVEQEEEEETENLSDGSSGKSRQSFQE